MTPSSDQSNPEQAVSAGAHGVGRRVRSARGGGGPWDRRGFLTAGGAALAAILGGCGGDSGSGVSAPGTTTGGSGGARDETPTPTGGEDSSGRSVIIVGAGAAGMSAAHLLRRNGYDVRILEAAPTYGGRIKHDREFADFPISLGGEWVHVEEQILDEIVADPGVDVSTELVRYGPSDQVAFVEGDSIELAPAVPNMFGVDSKFVGSSWLDFFEVYILPGVADAMTFNTQIVEIDHSGDTVVLTDAAGDRHEADHVIVTVPLRILQRRDITFVPPLDAERLDVIDSATVWSGFKAFFEFSEGFYPAAIAFDDTDTREGQRLFYDAAHGQQTDQNILGLFSVGVQAERYIAMSQDDFLADVLAELDAAYDGAASRTYVRHIVQNWNDEPFIGGAYLADYESYITSRRLAEPAGERLYFAGSEYTFFHDWSSVHTAARSAADVVNLILG